MVQQSQESLCRMPDGTVAFRVGVSEDRNRFCRRVMEDTHSFRLDYAGVPGQGFFGVFDGHGGKTSAEWCGEHFHETLSSLLAEKQNTVSISEILNDAYLKADSQLEAIQGNNSGCTVVTALLMVDSPKDPEPDKPVKAKRILYTANVGDARIVLSRNNSAVRLTYDHKASDSSEITRVQECGGFILGNRVNGMLAVTRALGDSVMKNCVIGNPFTVETELQQGDDFLILACDGVWDVCEDQEAVELIKDIRDAQEASQTLLKYAMDKDSTDNLTVMVVRFD